MYTFRQEKAEYATAWRESEICFIIYKKKFWMLSVLVHQFQDVCHPFLRSYVNGNFSKIDLSFIF